jgi:hypothetical protein
MTNADLSPGELLESLITANYQYLGATERELLWLIAERPGTGMAQLQERCGLDSDVLNTSLGWLEGLGYVCRCTAGSVDQEGRGLLIADGFLASWLVDREAGL